MTSVDGLERRFYVLRPNLICAHLVPNPNHHGRGMRMGTPDGLGEVPLLPFYLLRTSIKEFLHGNDFGHAIPVPPLFSRRGPA